MTTYIDLGLPSGTLWADRNIGTNKPEDYGHYFNFDDALNVGILPTIEQWRELINNCNWNWTIINGVNGRVVVSKNNGAKIFLPTAGCRINKEFYDIGYYGHYWSSNSLDSGYSRGIGFNSICIFISNNGRHIKSPVRLIKNR